MSRYDEVYGNWQRDPEGFWAEAAEAIDWTKRWDRVLDDSAAPSYRWFVGAETNTCVNAVDRHVAAGRGKQPAIIYDSPVTDTIRAITYAELQDETARCAGMLRQLGVQKGDRVIIYMPMVPETAIAMLACTRIGAIHSVVFGGFASNELATRINDARPKVILSASCGVEGTKVTPYKPLLDGAIDMAKHKPDAVVVLQRPMEQATMVPGRDHDWQEAVAAAPKADPATPPHGKAQQLKTRSPANDLNSTTFLPRATRIEVHVLSYIHSRSTAIALRCATSTCARRFPRTVQQLYATNLSQQPHLTYTYQSMLDG